MEALTEAKRRQLARVAFAITILSCLFDRVYLIKEYACVSARSIQYTFNTFSRKLQIPRSIFHAIGTSQRSWLVIKKHKTSSRVYKELQIFTSDTRIINIESLFEMWTILRTKYLIRPTNLRDSMTRANRPALYRDIPSRTRPQPVLRLNFASNRIRSPKSDWWG
jgi:hypothetical protein